MEKNIKKLFDLILENPAVPIIPMVDTEVVSGDEFKSWIGGWGNSELKEYALYPMDQYGESMIFEEQREKIVSDIMYKNKEISVSEAEECVMKLDWQKAIIVNIVLP